MVTKKKTRRVTGGAPLTTVMLEKGDWLDVMDHDGVWNVAQVLSVPSPDEVEVMYDGWPDDYDEVVRLDSHRVAPYHTYTWVVKCWVKYLNWPLWPSLVTIRTPGNEEGMQNLAMEDRLYVDFLDSPEFLKRDRCWQKKRQVRMFDPSYDKNRKETNGEQFERALECVLQSDATTKMPTFVKGTLPMQYKNTPALSVRKMRKDMGDELWFKNFANNKDRHYQTHIYDLVGVDKGDDDAASEESVRVSKPKSKPKRKDLKDGESGIKLEVQASRSKKRKVPKIERELEVEKAYELEEMNSSEKSDRSETHVSVPAKKRLRSKTRAAAEPLPTSIKVETKEGNAAIHMPHHVTVQLDDIIVDDDDDEDSSESARKKAAKRARKPTVRRPTSPSASKQIKKENSGERRLLLSESKTSRRENVASGHRELAAKEIDGRARQKHVRRTKSKDAGELHRKAWTAIFSKTADRFGGGILDSVGSFLQPQEEQSDGSGFSESFDPGTTSEEKATSPFDARIGSGDGVMPSIPDIAMRGKESAKRRHLDAEDLELTASPKPRAARLSNKHHDDEDEEKGVPRAFMKEYSTKKGVTGKLRTQPRSKKERETPAETSVPKRTGPARKLTKGAMPLIEQRIADTQKAIQLDEEKRRAVEAVLAKERARAAKANSASSLLLFGSLKAGESEGRRPQQQRSKLSLLARVAGDQNASFGWSEPSTVRKGRVQETAVNQPLQHDRMGHSFLSLDKSYSSNHPEAKNTRSAFEEDAVVVDDDVAVTSTAPEKTREKAKRAERNEKGMTADKEGVDPDLDRPVCEMRADMEAAVRPALDPEPTTQSLAKPPVQSSTRISMPKKFAGLAKGTAYWPSYSATSMLRVPLSALSGPGGSTNAALATSSTAVFSSSEGFSLDSWFKRNLYERHLDSKVGSSSTNESDKKPMRSEGDDEEASNDTLQRPRQPLYTIRQPPLVQPLRVSAFIQKTCGHDGGILAKDLAQEWVALFQMLGRGFAGEQRDSMALQIPDTILLSPSRHPSLWYATSASGRVKPKYFTVRTNATAEDDEPSQTDPSVLCEQRVSPQAILEAFWRPESPPTRGSGADDVVAVCRLGFQVQTLSSEQLKAFCEEMEHPSLCLPLSDASHGAVGCKSESSPLGGRSSLTKGVFCLQRYIPLQHNTRFLVVWRQFPGAIDTQRDRGPRSSHDEHPAHSDLFLLGQDATARGDQDENAVEGSGAEGDTQPSQRLFQATERLVLLEVSHPNGRTGRALQARGFDPEVAIPSLLYMKRVTSEIANRINRRLSTHQVCGLACEFFLGAHDRNVYFSALLGIQWNADAPSWELLRSVDPLSESLCEFYEATPPSTTQRSSGFSSNRRGSSPSKPSVRGAADSWALQLYEQQNPRFPSVQSPFSRDNQWLYRSQLLAPDISPRYMGAAVPKSYRDGQFQPLLTTQQTDSVTRLNLSPRAPASLAEVRRRQPHLSLSARSTSPRRRVTKEISTASDSTS